jgi:hypothetical protein
MQVLVGFAPWIAWWVLAANANSAHPSTGNAWRTARFGA